MPSFRCELKVRDLIPGEKYMFAVAAYTADGKLIGESVGESTKPILASHPLPLLITWSYLCQVSENPQTHPLSQWYIPYNTTYCVRWVVEINLFLC